MLACRWQPSKTPKTLLVFKTNTLSVPKIFQNHSQVSRICRQGSKHGAARKISATTASFSTGDRLQVPWLKQWWNRTDSREIKLLLLLFEG